MIPEMQQIDSKRRAPQFIVFAMIFLPVLLSFLVLWQTHQVSAQSPAQPSVKLQSSSFPDGGAIPRRFTCDGADISPSLQWPAPPAGTKSLAIVMDDPDAPVDFTHWLAYNIPPDSHGLEEGASAQASMTKGSDQGINDFRRLGYGGPCPPPGKPHHYVFRLYALDIRLNLPSGATKRQLESAMERHIVAEHQIIGIYRRTGE